MAKYIKTEDGYKNAIEINIAPLTDESVVLVDNLTYEDYNNGNYPKCTFIVGESYDVIINGVTYENLTCYLYEGWRVIGFNDECPYYIDDDGGDDLYIDDNIETITIIHSFKKIDKKYIPNDFQVQADWEETDENSRAFILNKPSEIKNRIIMADSINNCIYYVEMQNGNLVSYLNVEDTLIDFDYTSNNDGTYTLNAWKGTYKGEPSTKIVVPNNELFIVN